MPPRKLRRRVWRPTGRSVAAPRCLGRRVGLSPSLAAVRCGLRRARADSPHRGSLRSGRTRTFAVGFAQVRFAGLPARYTRPWRSSATPCGAHDWPGHVGDGVAEHSVAVRPAVHNPTWPSGNSTFVAGSRQASTPSARSRRVQVDRRSSGRCSRWCSRRCRAGRWL